MTKNALEAINNLDNDMIFSAMEKPEEKKESACMNHRRGKNPLDCGGRLHCDFDGGSGYGGSFRLYP